MLPEMHWNPVTGCSKVSPGCAHCYAETLACGRLKGKFGYPGLPWTPENAEVNVVLRPARIEDPLGWVKPRMVFVNSMSDLFHELVPEEFIAEVFAVMALASRHTFQVLTKRSERMRVLLGGGSFWPLVWQRMLERRPMASWPAEMRVWSRAYLPNVWLGVSIENRRYVDRADSLRETPAAVRFISAEPLLGPLVCRAGMDWPSDSDLDLREIDWLIAGGESGVAHRRCDPDWVRDLRDLCLGDGDAAEHRDGIGRTAFFLKQWGGRTPKAGGRELDGRTWDEMPQRELVLV